MKTNFKKLFLVITFSLIFLFGGLAVFASTNNQVYGTLSVSPRTVYTGRSITISVTGRDNDGLVRLEVYYQGYWHQKNVSGTSATRTWTITESLPGTYRYQGRVIGIGSGSSGSWTAWLGWLMEGTEFAFTSPEYIEVNVLNSTAPPYACECFKTTSCCDGCYYRPSTWVCDLEVQTQYGCTWGLGCGADTSKRTKTRYKYCSGDSSQCAGNWNSWLPWTNWKVSDYCSSSEVCIVGNSRCQYSSSCVQSEGTYIKEHKKDCYDNDIYWFDSNGERQDKYQECSDDNVCTIDGCDNSACFHDLKCDGTSCEISSSEYCENCEHCGDGICNCEENNDTCSDNCETALDEGLEQGKAAIGLTLQSLLKEWYVWLLLGIVAILLLYWLFRRPKE